MRDYDAWNTSGLSPFCAQGRRGGGKHGGSKNVSLLEKRSVFIMIAASKENEGDRGRLGESDRKASSSPLGQEERNWEGRRRNLILSLIDWGPMRRGNFLAEIANIIERVTKLLHSGERGSDEEWEGR